MRRIRKKKKSIINNPNNVKPSYLYFCLVGCLNLIFIHVFRLFFHLLFFLNRIKGKKTQSFESIMNLHFTILGNYLLKVVLHFFLYVSEYSIQKELKVLTLWLNERKFFYQYQLNGFWFIIYHSFSQPLSCHTWNDSIYIKPWWPFRHCIAKASGGKMLSKENQTILHFRSMEAKKVSKAQ